MLARCGRPAPAGCGWRRRRRPVVETGAGAAARSRPTCTRTCCCPASSTCTCTAAAATTSTRSPADLAGAVAFHRRHGTTATLVSLVTAPGRGACASSWAGSPSAAGPTADGRRARRAPRGPVPVGGAVRRAEPRHTSSSPTPTRGASCSRPRRGHLRAITVAPELPGALELVDAARRRRRRRRRGAHRRGLRGDPRRVRPRAPRWPPISTTACGRSTTASRARSSPRSSAACRAS